MTRPATHPAVVAGGGCRRAYPGDARIQPLVRGRRLTVRTDRDHHPRRRTSPTSSTDFIASATARRGIAHDNFCTLAQAFVTVNGERSRYFGPQGLTLNYSAGAVDSNLASDLFWQSIKASGVATSTLQDPPPVGPLPQVRQIFQGYVAGYNAYLASGQLHDPACAGQAWVRPITLTDMFLREFQIATEASSAQFETDEVDATPPGPGTTAQPSTAQPSTAQPSATRLDVAALASRFSPATQDGLGSNAVAVESQDTAAGDGMVLANPHYPWQGPERFWMAQLTVPLQYDVLGGTLEGFPLIGIGFNQHVAWTHTVSTSFRFTLTSSSWCPVTRPATTSMGGPRRWASCVFRWMTAAGSQTHTLHDPLGDRTGGPPGGVRLDGDDRLCPG